jgi:hypothetical protein
VSELLYAGKTLSEIAGYDNYQLKWVLFRSRDKYGRLIRVDSDLPPWVHVDERGMRVVKNPVGFGKMYRRLKARQGLSREKVAERWAEYVKAHPRLGRMRDS